MGLNRKRTFYRESMFILDGDKAEAPKSVPRNGGVGGKDHIKRNTISNKVGRFTDVFLWVILKV